MKTFASTILAAALAVAATAPALSCPYKDKQASLTDNSSYETAQKDSKSSSKTQ